MIRDSTSRSNHGPGTTTLWPQEDPANIGKVLSFLREWDRGDRTVRSRMLSTFVGQSAGKTCYELESDFAEMSSLFLARLTTCMRLTYMFGSFLGLQLKAIGVFLSASGHDQYLMEFLQDGGVLTLLDILSHAQTKEEDKAEALHLLHIISNTSLKSKEIICESNGVSVITESLSMSNTDGTHDKAWALLESLINGNPKFQLRIYKSLIALMDCVSPKCQRMVLHTLRIVQSKIKTANHSVVEPLLNMLHSIHPEVQDEAISLILDLRGSDVRVVLLSGLVTLLKPPSGDPRTQQITEEAEMTTGSLPVFVQQAAAAKAIRLLAEEDQQTGHDLLSMGVIQGLLSALGNREHTEAQIQASLALQHFVTSYADIEEGVHRVMGAALFSALMNQPETLYMGVDETQAEILLNNTVTSGIMGYEP